MLLGNYAHINSSPGKGIGGFTNPYQWMKVSNIMNFYYGGASVSGITDKSSFNNGYLPPYTWTVAPKAGGLGMSSLGSGSIVTNLIPQYLALADFTGSGDITFNIEVFGNLLCDLTGSSSFSADITADGNIEISLTGDGGITATISADGNVSIDMTGSGILSGDAALYLNMLCAMTGSGALSADAALLVSMLCDMTGDGTLTASITGQKEMVASMTGSGELSADITAFAEMILTLVGNGALTAGIGAIADMSIDIVVTGTGLTSENVGAAVWAALQADINNPGTAGAALLAAGSAGDPWSTPLPGAYGAGTAGELVSNLADDTANKVWATDLPDTYATGEAGRILAQIQELVDELHKIQGLDISSPMSVTPTTRDAGTIHLDITGDGETITTVTRA